MAFDRLGSFDCAADHRAGQNGDSQAQRVTLSQDAREIIGLDCGIDHYDIEFGLTQ